MSTHASLSGSQLHDMYHFVQESDPGAVGANKNWLQVSTGTVRRRKSDNTGWNKTSASKFTELTDCPASYEGEGGKILRVNVAETGLEFAIGSGGGGSSWATAPTTETSIGTVGDFAFDANGLYLCNPTNFWKFIPLQNFPGARGTYTYVSDGDANGVFNALGNYAGGGIWINPFTAGFLNLSFNSGIFLGIGGSYDRIVDRTASNFASNNVANSSLSIDLLSGRSLKLTKYSFRARSASGSYPTAWKFQGSNDNVNWTDLDTQTGLSFTANQWLSTTVSTLLYFRYFRLLMTAADSSSFDYLTIGELELYGIFR